MALHIPKFIDHNPNYSASGGGYYATNEEPELFNELLGKTKVKRAVCIASGGEVLLSVILRRAKEIVAVDHSYLSLANVYAKLLLLQEKPFNELAALLRKENYEELRKLVDRVSAQIPIAESKHGRSYDFNYNWNEVRREWCDPHTKFPKLQAALLNRITFLHADLRHVPEVCGTFDLFYASNAMEHQGHDRKSPTLPDYAKLLNPGGLLLYSAAYAKATKQLGDMPFEIVEMIKGFRTSWYHVLAQKK